MRNDKETARKNGFTTELGLKKVCRNCGNFDHDSKIVEEK